MRRPARVSAEVWELAVQLAQERAEDADGDAAFLQAARSVGVLVARATRYRQLIASVTAPGSSCRGGGTGWSRPRACTSSAVSSRAWRCTCSTVPRHVPQIEAPGRAAALLLLDALPVLPAGTTAVGGRADRLAGVS